jgi:hypothetical protein
MRVVTVAADDAGRSHFALHERSVDVDLFEDLPVGVIKTVLE